jgi:uncharacterized repeat protein (TIGR03806 family)
LQLTVPRVFTNLSFAAPVALLQAPGDGSRFFVVEQDGIVRAFQNSANVATSSAFIDVVARVNGGPGSEMGLLGMAFHPNWPANPRAYLSYTASNPLVSRISVFRSTDGGATLDASTEQILMTVSQPASNHNGGNVAFGPDGFLYIGLGDGGSGNDPFGPIGNGQNLQTLLGKMLRIDVNGMTGTAPYGIPTDNPFAAGALCGTTNGTTGQPNCAEIYAYGFRNPWRWSFDRTSGELWVADVGQGAREEVNRVVRGGNYGWRCFEGTRATGLACGNPQNTLPPVAEYERAAGASITGGHVYRGASIPQLVGRYVFGDYVSGNLWHIPGNTAPTLTVDGSTALDVNFNISSFAEGVDGELYVLNYAGTIHRLTAASGTGGGAPVAQQLSQTGCMSAANVQQPAAGLIPYAPNAPFWSDGAVKERWIALPNGQNITVGADGDWDFPNGSVLVKNFRLGTRLVETRLFMRHPPDGIWSGYSYQWNDQGTEATLVPNGATAQIAGQSWIFPSGSQCSSCHTQAAGRALGLETAQLNRDFTYPQTGRTANQVVTLNAISTLSPPVTAAPNTLPSMPDPYGSAGTLTERARAYLHTNCSHCHRPGGGTPTNLDLRYTTSLQATNACNADPQAGALGIVNARLIAPGDAMRSIIVARMSRRDADAMPPLASSVVDQAGVQLITSWINTVVTSCN